jgi:hypothetical protein
MTTSYLSLTLNSDSASSAKISEALIDTLGNSTRVVVVSKNAGSLVLLLKVTTSTPMSTDLMAAFEHKVKTELGYEVQGMGPTILAYCSANDGECVGVDPSAVAAAVNSLAMALADLPAGGAKPIKDAIAELTGLHAATLEAGQTLTLVITTEKGAIAVTVAAIGETYVDNELEVMTAPVALQSGKTGTASFTVPAATFDELHAKGAFGADPVLLVASFASFNIYYAASREVNGTTMTLGATDGLFTAEIHSGAAVFPVAGLATPITLSMPAESTKAAGAVSTSCAFWNAGEWSQDGCTSGDYVTGDADESESDHVSCSCDHLTEFAAAYGPPKPPVSTDGDGGGGGGSGGAAAIASANVALESSSTGSLNIAALGTAVAMLLVYVVVLYLAAGRDRKHSREPTMPA